jgi:ATP synthase protein I
MWRKTAEVGTVGLEMGIAVAIGFFVGNYLDTKFGTAPYLGFVGLFLGIAAAGNALWRITRKLREDQTD